MNIRKIVHSLTDENWAVGFIRNSIGGVLSGEEIQVDWVEHNYRDRWFADPFIFDVSSEEIVLLAEEYYKPIERGRIARLIVDRRTMKLKHCDTVLQLPTHLSFPAFIRRGDSVYVYPESGESGKLTLYRYDIDRNCCEEETVLLEEAVADAVISTVNGRELLFCTRQPNPNGNVLSVYERHDNSEYSLSYEYEFEENIARMAGNFFEYDGRLFRPTQECNVQYGHAVTLQEVISNNGTLHFDEKCRLYSPHPKLNIGMHTFNVHDGMIVTDALGFVRMWIRIILKGIGVLH